MSQLPSYKIRQNIKTLSFMKQAVKMREDDCGSSLMKWCGNTHEPLLKALCNCIAIYKTKFALKSIPNEKDTSVILKLIITW